MISGHQKQLCSWKQLCSRVTSTSVTQEWPAVSPGIVLRNERGIYDKDAQHNTSDKIGVLERTELPGLAVLGYQTQSARYSFRFSIHKLNQLQIKNVFKDKRRGQE